MGERTDERPISEADDPDLEGLLDDTDGGSAADTGDVGLSDDELGVDVDALTGDPDPAGSADVARGDDTAQSGGSGRSLLSRLRPSLGIPTPGDFLPSGRSVLATFLLVLASTVAVSAVPLVGSFGGVLGVFAGAFLLGAVSEKRRYLESALAGSAVAGLSMVLGAMGQYFRVAVLTDTGLAPFALVGVTTGFLTALLGHYFGRDLRAGLTRSVD